MCYNLREEEKFHYKINWYQKLFSFIDENHPTDSPLIVLGDFNVAQEDKDVWSPKEGFIKVRSDGFF